MPGATDDVNKGNLVERREISVERLTDAPQDTLYFCLADGNYKVFVENTSGETVSVNGYYK